MQPDQVKAGGSRELPRRSRSIGGIGINDRGEARWVKSIRLGNSREPPAFPHVITARAAQLTWYVLSNAIKRLPSIFAFFALFCGYCFCIRRTVVSPRIIIISTVSVIVQLGLTILAWGDWTSFFSHPARTWLVIGSFLLLILAWFSGSSGVSGGEKHSPESKTILYGFGVVLLLLTLIPPCFDRRNIWVIDGDAVRYFGLLLFFAGSILRLAAVFVLGRRFSGLVAIQPDHQLKTDGLYRYIRHPSYTGLIASMIGYVLIFRSAIGLVLIILLFLLLISRMNDEERFLEAHFGDEYRNYQLRTRRLVPFLY
jgi:protein-S-isoprenylcysteine O-methyltransferase Ste14